MKWVFLFCFVLSTNAWSHHRSTSDATTKQLVNHFVDKVIAYLETKIPDAQDNPRFRVQHQTLRSRVLQDVDFFFESFDGIRRIPAGKATQPRRIIETVRSPRDRALILWKRYEPPLDSIDEIPCVMYGVEPRNCRRTPYIHKYCYRFWQEERESSKGHDRDKWALAEMYRLNNPTAHVYVSVYKQVDESWNLIRCPDIEERLIDNLNLQ